MGVAPMDPLDTPHISALLMDNSALSTRPASTPSRPGSAPSNLESTPTPTSSKKPRSRSAMAIQRLRDLRTSSPDPLLAHGFPRQQKQGLGPGQGQGQGPGPAQGQGQGPEVGSYGVHSTLASNNNVNSFSLSTVTRDLPWGAKDKPKGDRGNSNTHTLNNRPPGTPIINPALASTYPSTHQQTQQQTQQQSHQQNGGSSPSTNTLPTSSTPQPPPSLADLNLDPRLATLAKDLSPLHFETGPHNILSTHLINALHQPTLSIHSLSTHPLKPSAPYQYILSTHPINQPYHHNLSTHPINISYSHIHSPLHFKQSLTLPITKHTAPSWARFRCHPAQTRYHC